MFCSSMEEFNVTSKFPISSEFPSSEVMLREPVGAPQAFTFLAPESASDDVAGDQKLSKWVRLHLGEVLPLLKF